MDVNKLTIKSQEALAAAQQLAASRNHQSIEPEHILHSLLSQPDGVVFALIQKLGAAPGSVRNHLDEILDRMPKVYGSGSDEPRISVSTGKVFDAAFSQAAKLGDEYVSTEHLLLALVEAPGNLSS